MLFRSVFAVYNIAYSVGMSGSGLLAGLLVSKFSFTITLLLTSAILLLAFPFVFSAASPRERPRSFFGSILFSRR